MCVWFCVVGLLVVIVIFMLIVCIRNWCLMCLLMFICMLFGSCVVVLFIFVLCMVCRLVSMCVVIVLG